MAVSTRKAEMVTQPQGACGRKAVVKTWSML